MDSWHVPLTQSNALLTRTEIPRRVLARLLSATGIGVGYSVLDVGCGRGELAQYLDSLGIHYTGIDESPQNVVEARRAVPTCEFSRASIDEPLATLQTEFDLVLVRDAAVYGGSLFSRSAFRATLRLLSRVRPKGCLAFLARTDTGERGSTGHRFACYGRHIASLPGHHDSHDLPNGLVFGRRLRSLQSEPHGPGYAIAVLRPPSQYSNRVEATRAIDVRVPGDQAPCCQWGAGAAAQAIGWRSKAA